MPIWRPTPQWSWTGATQAGVPDRLLWAAFNGVQATIRADAAIAHTGTSSVKFTNATGYIPNVYATMWFYASMSYANEYEFASG